MISSTHPSYTQTHVQIEELWEDYPCNHSSNRSIACYGAIQQLFSFARYVDKVAIFTLHIQYGGPLPREDQTPVGQRPQLFSYFRPFISCAIIAIVLRPLAWKVAFYRGTLPSSEVFDFINLEDSAESGKELVCIIRILFYGISSQNSKYHFISSVYAE